MKAVAVEAVFLAYVISSMQLWHEKLGHQNKCHVKCVVSHYGVHLTGNEFCDGCALAKAHSDPFHSRPDPPKEPGAVTSADICKPMETTTFDADITSSHDENETPLEIWTGETVRDLKHLKVLETQYFVYKPKQKRKKWDTKSIAGILVGYHGLRDGYRVYVSSERYPVLVMM
ncbi:hypothetical protein ILUMI_09346 [Ignelater luminosus]|uniref:Retroviral polymerase SH3-like domain-containing protein n=1 Tax=Ignelater luminosus TaxID=2038154 RepID=A0A8K0CZX6_IGNLU|nr:hypothetical protein ILUMI_09346 [Ignelater luminosus]